MFRWSLKLRQSKPALVANWGKNLQPKHPSHSGITSKSCRAVSSVAKRSDVPRFARCDTAVDAMTKGARIVLQNHLPRFVENQRETSQPRGHSPDQARWNDRLVITCFQSAFLSVCRGFMGVGITTANGIANQAVTVSYCRAIRGPMLLQVVRGQGQQARSREPLIGQDESRDSR